MRWVRLLQLLFLLACCVLLVGQTKIGPMVGLRTPVYDALRFGQANPYWYLKFNPLHFRFDPDPDTTNPSDGILSLKAIPPGTTAGTGIVFADGFATSTLSDGTVQVSLSPGYVLHQVSLSPGAVLHQAWPAIGATLSEGAACDYPAGSLLVSPVPDSKLWVCVQSTSGNVWGSATLLTSSTGQ